MTTPNPAAYFADYVPSKALCRAYQNAANGPTLLHRLVKFFSRRRINEVEAHNHLTAALAWGVATAFKNGTLHSFQLQQRPIAAFEMCSREVGRTLTNLGYPKQIDFGRRILSEAVRQYHEGEYLCLAYQHFRAQL